MATTSPDLKLFGMWASPFVHRVQHALKVKGLQYEFMEEDLFNKSPSLLLYNPIHKKVPVLLHNGRPIVESYIILEYIDETWKENPIFPDDPYERAIVRFWCHFSADKLGPSLIEVCRTTGMELKAAADQVLDNLKLLEAELRDGFFKGRRFFGGERIGVLDIVLGLGAHWFLALEEIASVKFVDQESFPCFCSWVHNFLGLEEVKEIYPSKEKLVVYVKGLREKHLGMTN